jgi:predicted transcriptional regulator
MHKSDPASINISKLKKLLSAKFASGQYSISEIQKKTEVNQSQISRISRGQFKRASTNVRKICDALGLKLSNQMEYEKRDIPEVIRKALDIAWDGTPEQASQYAKLISTASNIAHR